MKDGERDQEANVVDTAVQVLGVVAQHLEWPQYQELLGIFNRAMQRTEGKVRRSTAALDQDGVPWLSLGRACWRCRSWQVQWTKYLGLTAGIVQRGISVGVLCYRPSSGRCAPS